jgi:hypothetical protein
MKGKFSRTENGVVRSPHSAVVNIMSLDSSVGILNRLGARRSGVRKQEQEISSSPKCPDRL